MWKFINAFFNRKWNHQHRQSQTLQTPKARINQPLSKQNHIIPITKMPKINSTQYITIKNHKFHQYRKIYPNIIKTIKPSKNQTLQQKTTPNRSTIANSTQPWWFYHIRYLISHKIRITKFIRNLTQQNQCQKLPQNQIQ